MRRVSAVAELRASLEALRSELDQLREQIARNGRREAPLEDRIEAVASQLQSAISRISGLGSDLRGDYYRQQVGVSSREYWTRHKDRKSVV